MRGKRGFQKGHAKFSGAGKKKGFKTSQKTKDKISIANSNPSKETRERKSKAAIKRFSKKENHPMYGKSFSKETKDKIGIGHWKGGPNASRARVEEKRRNFSFIPLNDWFPGCERHHIDREFVIHIPKEMHRSIYHSVIKNINMDLINDLAIDFCYGD